MLEMLRSSRTSFENEHSVHNTKLEAVIKAQEAALSMGSLTSSTCPSSSFLEQAFSDFSF